MAKIFKIMDQIYLNYEEIRNNLKVLPIHWMIQIEKFSCLILV